MATNNRFRERDPFGEEVWLDHFDWKDKRIWDYIEKFREFGEKDAKSNVERLDAVRSAQLLNSIKWKAWEDSGGDAVVFQATMLKYGQYVELAVGRGEKYSPIDPIPHRAWGPIKVSGHKRLARPHTVTEMRKQARKFETLIVNHFSFIGLAYLTYAAGSNRTNYDEINKLIMSEEKI